MLKTVQMSALTATLLVWSAIAMAQTAPGTPAAPGAGTAGAGTTAAGDTNWLWIIVVVALIAAAIWYFMRSRGRGTSV